VAPNSALSGQSGQTFWKRNIQQKHAVENHLGFIQSLAELRAGFAEGEHWEYVGTAELLPPGSKRATAWLASSKLDR
jgi:hypothetical protein